MLAGELFVETWPLLGGRVGLSIWSLDLSPACFQLVFLWMILPYLDTLGRMMLRLSALVSLLHLVWMLWPRDATTCLPVVYCTICLHGSMLGLLLIFLPYLYFIISGACSIRVGILSRAFPRYPPSVRFRCCWS